MNSINKYFDININHNNNTFSIIETSCKPHDEGSALVTLKKIEYVVKNHLQYDREANDSYSSRSESEVLRRLKEKSIQIHTAYQEKKSKSIWPFSKGAAVHSVHQRICDLIENPNRKAHLGYFSISTLRDQTLFFAVSNGLIGPVRAALKYKASIDSMDSNGETLLTLAVAANQITMVKFLIQNRANPNKPNSRGQTPLMLAQSLHPNRFEMSRLLLENGAEKAIDLVEQKQGAALHTATRKGTVGVVNLLLEHGADIDVKDAKGRTPLALAVIFQRDKLVKLFIKNGADLRACDLEGKSILALSHKNQQIQSILLDAMQDC